MNFNSNSNTESDRQKPFGLDAANATLNPQTRSSVRPVAAVHGGFGFGAGAIKKKSIEIAVAESEIKESRRNLLRQQTGPSDYSKVDFSAGSSSVSPIVSPTKNFVPFTPTLSSRQPMVFATPKQVVRKSENNVSQNKSTAVVNNGVKQVPHSVTQQPIKTVTSNALRTVETSRALFAWTLDTMVAASAFAIAAGTNFAAVNPEGASPVISMLNRLIPGGNLYYTVFMLNITITALAILFAAQLVMLLFTGATAGRFAMNITLVSYSVGQRLVRGMWAALSETATFGGVFSLPFLLVMPSRVSLAPWVRYRVKHEG